MKVEELYSTDKDSQVGVTFQRQPFETQVDIFPEVSPLKEPEKSVDMSQYSGEPVETALTSVQMEGVVCRAVRHQGEEEFQPIPLKRVDGPTEHRLQGVQAETERKEQSKISPHEELLREIDAGEATPTGEVKLKRDKKEGTLTRMKERLKSLRKYEEKGEKYDEGKPVSKSLSKIFQRVNPVGKASRESFSRVFHKIGDALKKEEGKEEAKEAKGEDMALSLDSKDVEKKLRHRDQGL